MPALVDYDVLGSHDAPLSPLCKLETLHLTIFISSGFIIDWTSAAQLLSTIQCKSTLHTVILGAQAFLAAEEEAKEHVDHAACDIKRVEDLLLGLATSGALNKVILSFGDYRHSDKRVQPFHEIVSCFKDIFPRLGKNGILTCIGVNKVCHIQFASLIYQSDLWACSEEL